MWVHGASFYDPPCSQATYSSSIHAVEQLLYKSVLPKGSWRHITPVQHGDKRVCLPTKTEKWKQSSLHPNLQSVWSYLFCHNITSPSLQYLGAQPTLLFLFNAGIIFFFSSFRDRLPLAAPHAHSPQKSLTHVLISSERCIFVIPALPPRKVLFCRCCFVNRQSELL